LARRFTDEAGTTPGTQMVADSWVGLRHLGARAGADALGTSGILRGFSNPAPHGKVQLTTTKPRQKTLGLNGTLSYPG